MVDRINCSHKKIRNFVSFNSPIKVNSFEIPFIRKCITIKLAININYDHKISDIPQISFDSVIISYLISINISSYFIFILPNRSSSPIYYQTTISNILVAKTIQFLVLICFILLSPLKVLIESIFSSHLISFYNSTQIAQAIPNCLIHLSFLFLIPLLFSVKHLNILVRSMYPLISYSYLIRTQNS